MRSDRRSTLFSLLIRNFTDDTSEKYAIYSGDTKGHGYSRSEKLAQYEMIDKKIQKGPGNR